MSKLICLAVVFSLVISVNAQACSGCKELPAGFTDEEVEILSVPYGWGDDFYSITWKDKKTGVVYLDRVWVPGKPHDEYIRDRKAANWWPYETSMPEEGWGSIAKPINFTLTTGRYGFEGDEQPCVILKSDDFWVDRADLVEIIEAEGGDYCGNVAYNVYGKHWSLKAFYIVEGNLYDFIERIHPKIAEWGRKNKK